MKMVFDLVLSQAHVITFAERAFMTHLCLGARHPRLASLRGLFIWAGRYIKVLCINSYKVEESGAQTSGKVEPRDQSKK